MQEFLGLPRKGLHAESQSCEPPSAPDAYVSNTAQCDLAYRSRFEPACAAKYAAMLHDRAWPYDTEAPLQEGAGKVGKLTCR